MRRASPASSIETPADALSLFGGGLFYRWQLLCRLTTPTQWRLPRRVTWTVAVTWLPLVVLTAVFHPEQLSGLLQDYGVYARIVIAIPVLLIGQFLMESRFRVLAIHLREADLLDEAGQLEIDNVISILRRLRDSAIPELIIVIMVFSDLVLLGQNKLIRGATWAVATSDPAPQFSIAGWYYLLVSMALYQFLILFTLWKWLLWSFFLIKLSRTRLKLVATHADGHGGLGFLGLAAAAFNPIALALSASIGSTWRYDILHSGVTLASLQLPAIGLLVLIFVAELGPMCFFVPKLTLLRSQALLEYGITAQAHASYFHKKWILRGAGREQERFEVSDVATLAFVASYDRIKRMRSFPVDKRVFIGLALAVLIPLIPVVPAEIPLAVILRGLVDAVRAAPL